MYPASSVIIQRIPEIWRSDLTTLTPLNVVKIFDLEHVTANRQTNTCHRSPHDPGTGDAAGATFIWKVWVNEDLSD